MAPPRKINVQKFAEARSSELEALHGVVSSRLNNDFRSQRNKRRRTTAYNSQAAKRRYRRRPKLLCGGEGRVDDSVLPRRVRRRIALRKNPESGFVTSGDGTKRMRTHLWHAKRFKMVKLWGFYLPLHMQGSGRGSRAILRRLKEGVVVHDASYLVPIQLDGSEDSLVSVLKMVFVPSSVAESEDTSRLVRAGVIYGNAMLHHVGAPLSQPIAPVKYMWRPSNQMTLEDDGNGIDSVKCKVQPSTEICFPHCQLWVWIHASVFNEGFDALKFACQKQIHEKGEKISCSLLEGQLAKFQLIGPKAFQVLQKILQPVRSVPESSWQLKKCSASDADDNSEAQRFAVPSDEKPILCHAILSYIVKDPRLIAKKGMVDVSGFELAKLPEAEAEAEDEVEENVAVTKASNINNEPLLSSWSNSERPGHSGIMTLWDPGSRLSPPEEENVLCTEKHHQRMDFLCLDDSKSSEFKPSTEVQCSRSCPILVLKDSDQNGSWIGWSIILPLSWAKIFWIALVSSGACAIGLWEKRWIACEVGFPYFPLDFPDCSAYQSYVSMEAASLTEEANKRPPSVRPFKIPVKLPWSSIPACFEKGPTHERETDVADGNSLSVTTSGNSATPTLGYPTNFFKGIVARKSSQLTNFLHEIHCEDLPLFPCVTNRRTGCLNFTNDKRKFGHDQNMTIQICHDRKLCFLRVLLRAFKEGAFEDGAVVCAPSLTDISLLTTSINGGVQMPQSAVASFWKEQPSGEWEHQPPEEPALSESHRWPIGFITTGFVHGSKKPVAVAFCEAVLLAQLRAEQWNDMPVKRQRKEVYVLVRNLRSSAYRLSLATIVLETQEEDIGDV